MSLQVRVLVFRRRTLKEKEGNVNDMYYFYNFIDYRGRMGMLWCIHYHIEGIEISDSNSARNISLQNKSLMLFLLASDGLQQNSHKDPQFYSVDSAFIKVLYI